MTPYTDEQWAWVEKLATTLKGYWISPTGALHVTDYTPSRWERFCSWWFGWSWVPHDFTRGSARRK